MKKDVLLLLSAVVFFGACGSDESKNQTAQATPTSVATPAATTPAQAEPTAAPAIAGESTFKTKCASCHGSDAKGRADFPKLAGQTKADLEKKLNGYKNGTFGNKMKAVMEPNAKSLSSTQIEDVAQYIASLK